LTFQIFAAFAEFERSLIVSRTVEGKRYARAHDPSFHEGHPYQYSDEQIKLAYDLWTQGNTHKMIESKTGISISTQKKRFRELKAKGIIKEDEQKEQKEKA
jgi:DNA invertase Pin-like site-specific DNA recombinase